MADFDSPSHRCLLGPKMSRCHQPWQSLPLPSTGRAHPHAGLVTVIMLCRGRQWRGSSAGPAIEVASAAEPGQPQPATWYALLRLDLHLPEGG